MNKMILCLGAVAATVSALAQTAPNIITQPTNQTKLLGSNLLISVAASGIGPFAYQWQLNGTNLPNDIVTTIAGNGSGAFSGDGALSTNASLYLPSDVTFDSAGNLFIADQMNHRIRKISTNGIISTVAGNGTGTFSGDGGMATNASLNYPTGIAEDSTGNLYIADQGNNRIRKILTTGQIQTVAGNGASAFSGDGGQATIASLNSPGRISVFCRVEGGVREEQ